MKKVNEKLSEALNVNPIIKVEEPENLPEVIQTEKSSHEDDADFARTNIKNLINKGNSAIENLLHVAKESEQPRAYEVAANMIKNLSEINKDLLEIHKREKDLEPKESASQKINVDKAVFVGSTTELVKFLKKNK